MELQLKRDENTINDVAEKLKLIYNTDKVTKEDILHKIVAKYVVKTR